MSPTVDCLVVRATFLSSQIAPTETLGQSARLLPMESLETLARHVSPRGQVLLRRRIDEGHCIEELIINGVFAMDSSETSTESMLAELALPNEHAQRVLVGGLGLGYTVAAVSAQNVDAIDVVEIEECLIDWSHRGVTATLKTAAADPRTRLYAGDIREVFGDAPHGPVGPWDAIILDVDNGPDFLIFEENSELYTDAGLRAAYARLTPGGTLAIWCQCPVPALSAALQRIAPSAEEHIIEVVRGRRSFRYAIYTLSRPRNSIGRARQE